MLTWFLNDAADFVIMLVSNFHETPFTALKCNMFLSHSVFRPMNKEEKERENQRKVSPAPIRLARPKTAPSKKKVIIIVLWITGSGSDILFRIWTPNRIARPKFVASKCIVYSYSPLSQCFHKIMCL